MDCIHSVSCVPFSSRMWTSLVYIGYTELGSFLYLSLLCLYPLCIHSGTYRFSYVDAFDFSDFFPPMLTYFSSLSLLFCASVCVWICVGLRHLLVFSCSLGCQHYDSNRMNQSDAKFILFSDQNRSMYVWTRLGHNSGCFKYDPLLVFSVFPPFVAPKRMKITVFFVLIPLIFGFFSFPFGIFSLKTNWFHCMWDDIAVCWNVRSFVSHHKTKICNIGERSIAL